MSAILKLVQGSPEWHAHRSQSRNASETPVVLGYLAVEDARTSSGRSVPGAGSVEVTPPMRRGKELEPAARRAYEALTGLVMEPLVLAEGDYSASLDGITLDGALILEVKCPVKGQASELWQQVAAGELPDHYYWQVQHQLMVSDALLAHVFVFDGTLGKLVEVDAGTGVLGADTEAWDAFMKYIETDTPPPLTDGTRWSAQIRVAAGRERVHRREARSRGSWRSARCRQGRARGLTSHPSETGCGVTVTRYWKAGTIDYKKVPELKEVDWRSTEERGGSRYG